VSPFSFRRAEIAEMLRARRSWGRLILPGLAIAFLACLWGQQSSAPAGPFQAHFMASEHRAMAILDAVLTCLAISVAAWLSPYVALDGGIVVLGTAFAWLISWRERWSWRFMIRCVVKGYLFRCVVMYTMGGNTVRIIAIRDAALAIAVIWIAWFVRNAIGRRLRDGTWTSRQEPDREATALSTTCPAGEEAGVALEATVRPAERDDAVWSPPQFSLKALLMATFAWSAVLGVGATAGYRASFGMLVLGVFWFLIASCIQLVSAGRRRGK
jgi:hypothetical protein